MQPAHLAPVAVALAGEQLQRVGAVAQGPGQPAQPGHVVVGRQQVGAAQAVQLQPVLDGPQPAVRLREVAGVLAADVALLGERRQRRQRAAAAHRRVGAAVHELEQLHGELDVAQAALAELDLAVGLVRPSVDTTRRRIACTSSTKPGRPAAVHTSGATAST